MRTALGIGKGILKVLFVGIGRRRRIYYELHRRNYLCYHRMRGVLWLRKKKRLSVVLREKLRDSQQRGKGAGNKAV